MRPDDEIYGCRREAAFVFGLVGFFLAGFCGTLALLIYVAVFHLPRLK